MSSERNMIVGDESSDAPALRRSLTLPLLTLYGLGVTVGAGIYVLIGATVAQAGPYAWVAFLLAAFVVGFTAFSYAELATRYPVSAGESAYVEAGFGRPRLATVVGLLVAISGMVSASAIAVGASGYLGDLSGLPSPPLIVGIVGAMGLLAWWGITQSVMAAAIVTVIEILGLAFVIVWGIALSEQNGIPVENLLPPLKGNHWGGILSASLLAFFAFIGFEDIVNMAEEVDQPNTTLPRSILVALGVTTVIYALVAVAAVRSVDTATISVSRSPLVLVWQAGRGGNGDFLSGIAVFAALNGVLAQIVMASRVLFGLGRHSPSLAVFHRAHPRLGTPVLATCLIGAAVVVIAVGVQLVTLAGVTSAILLSVFLLVNLALIFQKRREPKAPFTVPMVVPVLGFTLSILALIGAVWGAF